MQDSEMSQHGTTILKELSDIKASLAVNTNETANIKSSVGEIKNDVKEIRKDLVTRREFDELKSTSSTQGQSVEELKLFVANLKGKYAVIAFIVMTAISAGISLALKFVK